MSVSRWMLPTTFLGFCLSAPQAVAQLGEAPPTITITSPAAGSTRHALNPQIRVEYDTGECIDDGSGNCDPNPNTLIVKLNNVTITSSFTKTEWYAQNGTGNAGANNFNANQWNTVYAKICNGHSLCTETTISTYISPNPQQRLIVSPLHPAVSDLSKCETVPFAPGATFACDALLIEHGIPGYVSVDHPRAIAVVYSSRSAIGQVTVPFDVELIWDAAASTVQAWLSGYGSTYWDGRGWDGTTGTVTRRAVLSRSEITATSGYIGRQTLNLTVRVNTAAGIWDSTKTDTLLYYFERDSLTTPIARGWSITGISRIYAASGHSPGSGAPSGDVLVVGGAPGATYFYKKLSGNSYGRPEGAFATLTRYGASNNHWERLYFDGSREYYSWVTSLGYARLDSVEAGGRVTKIAYRSGSSGSPATITDPQGKQIRFDYTGTGVGKLSKICAPAGANERCTTLIYGTSGGNTVVTAIKDPDNVQTTFGYGGPHWALIKTFTPRAHGTYAINYHGAVNRASGVTMPSSSDVLSYTAPQLAGFALTGGTVGSPAATAHPDSGWGSITRPLGGSAYFSADRFGGARFSKDPAGVVTDIWHGLDGQVIRVARNFQVLEYTSYNTMGAASWTRLENGDTTFFTYGGDCATGTGYPCLPTQRVLRRPPTAPDTVKTWYQDYSNLGLVDSTYQSAFGSTHYTRESSGLRRATKVTDPQGHETNYTYESTWGNTRYVIRDSAKVCSPTCVWDRDTTVFEPTSQGRTWWTRRGAMGRRGEYGYDMIGRVTSTRDSTGGASVIVTQTIYNDVTRTVTVRMEITATLCSSPTSGAAGSGAPIPPRPGTRLRMTEMTDSRAGRIDEIKLSRTPMTRSTGCAPRLCRARARGRTGTTLRTGRSTRS